MTRGELKTKLEEVCEKNVTILDVFFYKHKEYQMVVVPYIREYGAMSPSMDCVKCKTIEEIVLYFYDTKRLGTTAMFMSGNNIQSANAMIEEL